MASVSLTFIPPSRPGFVKLHIFETADPAQLAALIDTIENIGSYPNYITKASTNNAAAIDDWFAIQWEDDQGVVTVLSELMKGGVTTLIGELVNRVIMRNPAFDGAIVVQETEGVISFVYNVDDPYTIELASVNKLWMVELTNLIFVACEYLNVLLGASSSNAYTAGVISESTSTSSLAILDSLEKLEKRSLRRLGIGGSWLASIDRGTVEDRLFSVTGDKTLIDVSRLLSTKAIITEEILVQDIPTGFVISA